MSRKGASRRRESAVVLAGLTMGLLWFGVGCGRRQAAPAAGPPAAPTATAEPTSATTAPVRTWINREGKEVRGSHCRHDAEQVWIAREKDGRVLACPLAELSDADLAHLGLERPAATEVAAGPEPASESAPAAEPATVAAAPPAALPTAPSLQLPDHLRRLDVLVTTDGKTYRGLSVTKVAPDGIQVQHENGAGFVKYEVLPPAMQQAIGFDAAYAAAYRQQREAAQQQARAARDARVATLAAEASADAQPATRPTTATGLTIEQVTAKLARKQPLTRAELAVMAQAFEQIKAKMARREPLTPADRALLAHEKEYLLAKTVAEADKGKENFKPDAATRKKLAEEAEWQRKSAEAQRKADALWQKQK